MCICAYECVPMNVYVSMNVCMCICKKKSIFLPFTEHIQETQAGDSSSVQVNIFQYPLISLHLGSVVKYLNFQILSMSA